MLDPMEEKINKRIFYSAGVESYLLVLILYLIFLVGVFANSSIIAIYVRYKPMRNTPNTYVLSLSLVNLLFILICIPLTSITYIMERWPFGVGLCKILIVLKQISFGVPPLTFVLLSASRYRSIVDPFRGLKLRPITKVGILSTWLLATALSIPEGVLINLTELYHSNGTTIVKCTSFTNDAATVTYIKWNMITKTLVLYLIPLVVIAILFIIMNKKLNDRPKIIAHSKKMKRGKLVIYMVIVFAICFFPYYLFDLWSVFSSDVEADYNWFWNTLKIVGVCLSFGHSCVNPIVVYCTRETFRDHLKGYLSGLRLVNL